VVVTIYSRQGCGCCRKAKDVIEGFRGRYSLQLEEVDVDRSAELKERYGNEVPVVEVGGQVRFRGKVDRVMFERLLRAEGASA